MTREEVLDNWLTVALESHFREEPSSPLLERILAADPVETETTHRGLRLLVATAVVAAAATVALIFLLPGETPFPSQSGAVTPAGGAAPNEEDVWTGLQTIVADADTNVDVGADESVLVRGSVSVNVEPGATYTVQAGALTLILTGPAKARVTLMPMRQMGPTLFRDAPGTGNPALYPLRFVPMVTLIVQLREGRATLNGMKLTAPMVEQRILTPVSGDESWAAPLSMRELFTSLDENRDGVLRPDEITGALAKLLDTDANGSISFAEFEPLETFTAEKTPLVIPFSREFREMDRDDNGRLTPDEIGEDAVRVGDRNDSGGLELSEAEELFGGARSGNAVVTDLFSYFDVNGNGKIEVDEIAPDVMLELDANESGTLDRREFERFTPERFRHPLTPAQSFKRSDINGDGELSREEFSPDMIRMSDTDGDSRLTFDEFKKLLERMTPEGK